MDHSSFNRSHLIEKEVGVSCLFSNFKLIVNRFNSFVQAYKPTLEPKRIDRKKTIPKMKATLLISILGSLSMVFAAPIHNGMGLLVYSNMNSCAVFELEFVLFESIENLTFISRNDILSHAILQSISNDAGAVFATIAGPFIEHECLCKR